MEAAPCRAGLHDERGHHIREELRGRPHVGDIQHEALHGRDIEGQGSDDLGRRPIDGGLASSGGAGHLADRHRQVPVESDARRERLRKREGLRPDDRFPCPSNACPDRGQDDRDITRAHRLDRPQDIRDGPARRYGHGKPGKRISMRRPGHQDQQQENEHRDWQPCDTPLIRSGHAPPLGEESPQPARRYGGCGVMIVRGWPRRHVSRNLRT